MDAWEGYVEQVRERYIAREITLEQFEHDLAVAVRLDHGLLPEQDQIPLYLRDRLGFPLVSR